jgi:hypothetical protein
MSSSELSSRGWRTLYGHISLARISNSPTVASNVLAGAALAGVVRPDAPVLLLIVALILFYTAGMYLNDLFDLEFDRRERPERPLPSGVVSRQSATLVVVVLFGLGSALLWLVSSTAFWSGLVLIGLIVLYDAWHKTNPLSPVLMASTRMMVYLIAFLAFSTTVTSTLLAWTGLLGLYIIGLTYIAKLESRPGLMRYWPGVLLFLPVVYTLAQWPGVLPFIMALLFGGWAAYSLTFLYRRQGRSIGGAVARLIAGISLLDGLVLAVTGSVVGTLVALVAFGLTLTLQRYVKGT